MQPEEICRTQPYFESPQVTLYHGDCLEVMPEFEPQSFDMVLCDLPYGTTACSWDIVIPFESLWEQYRRLIKPNGAVVLFGSQPFTTDLITSNREWFKYQWIWEKTQPSGHLDVNRRPMRAHEDIAVFGKSITYNPQITVKPSENIRPAGRGKTSPCYGSFDPNSPRLIDTNLSYPKSVVKFSNETGYHPTQKPIALLQYLIKTYTNEGDRVLDNTCGSGSTLVAARDTGRYAVGIEKEEKYCKIAADRCSQLSIYSALEVV